jgi:hypothetical protein
MDAIDSDPGHGPARALFHLLHCPEILYSKHQTPDVLCPGSLKIFFFSYSTCQATNTPNVGRKNLGEFFRCNVVVVPLFEYLALTLSY